jgi:hypothetical protein
MQKFNIEEIDADSAIPQKPSGIINIAPRRTLKIIDITAVCKGVLVSSMA